MRLSGKGKGTAGPGALRARVPSILGTATMLFVAQAAMSPAEPAEAPSFESRAKPTPDVAAPLSAPRLASAYVAPAASPGPIAPAFKLIGVFTELGGQGSAIVVFGDDRQRGAEVGEELVPGLLLIGVQSDGVTVSHRGATYSVRLGRGLDPLQPGGAGVSSDHPKLTQAPLPLPVPAAAQIARSATNGRGSPGPSAETWRSALDDIKFAPRRNGAAVTGALVQPTSSESAQIVGLLPGDVILSVGGKRISSADAVAGIGRELASRRDALVQVQRGQRVQRLHLRGSRDALE